MLQLTCSEGHTLPDTSIPMPWLDGDSPETYRAKIKAWCAQCSATMVVSATTVTTPVMELNGESHYSMTQISEAVFRHERGCRDGKIEFLRDQFCWEPPSPWLAFEGQEFSVTITCRVQVNDSIQTQAFCDTDNNYDDDTSVQAVIRALFIEHNLNDNIEGLDFVRNYDVEVNWS